MLKHRPSCLMRSRRLLDVFVALLPVAFPGKRFFGAALLARLQVKGVTLDLLDDVFLLHLALKATKSGLESLALLHVDFSQTKLTSPGLVKR